MFGFEQPVALWLLPLALLPLLFHGQHVVAHPAPDLLPADRLSSIVDGALRIVPALALAALTLGIAGIHRVEQRVERIGQGAQVVMLIDSSGSMDRPYVTGNKGTSRVPVWGTYRSKGQIARELLAEYAARRHQDMFALFVFSSNPIAVLPLTDKQAAIQSAITAGTIERGLATTDLAAGIVQSLDYFKDLPYSGSRVMLLLSDGSATLLLPQQDRIRNLLEKYRVSLYWLYMRDQHSPGLVPGPSGATAPEQQVHAFFSNMGLPYRAYSAEDPSALKEAIAEVDKLQNLPIRYQDIVPRTDLSPWCYGAALLGLAVLLLARLAEVDAWD